MKITKMTTGVKKYRVDWTDASGKRRRLRFKTRREANEFLSDVTITERTGTWIDPEIARGVTVHKVYESWIKRIEEVGARGKRPAKPKTLSGYTSMYSARIKPDWEYVTLDQVTHGRVAEWCKAMSTGSRTRYEAASILLRIMDHAVRLRLVAANPARDATGQADYLPTVKTQKDHIYLTARQVKTLLDAIEDDMSRLAVAFGAFSGLRWGEASAVRWGDVDLERRLLRIQRAYSEVRGQLVLGSTKGGEDRTVPLHDPTMRLLERLPRGTDNEEVLKTLRGHTMRNGNFTKRVIIPTLEALHESGVKDAPPLELRYHGLRHTAVSLAISAKANPKVVQAIAGHSSAVHTLDVYGGLFVDDVLAAGADVDAYLRDTFA